MVYCRPHVVDRRLNEWRGARLVHLPTVRNKYLDTFVHTFLSALHAAHRERPDVALFFIAGNSPMCLITRGANIPTVINVDGLDSDRRKWPAPAQRYLRLAERTAPHWADSAITDSHAVAEVFERRYGERIGVVPYGVEDPGYDGTGTLERLGLQERRYILFVGRLEPENNPHLLVEAFARFDAARARGMKLVIVGGAPYADEYIRGVMRRADPRVLFPGYVFGRGYWELQRHAYVFCAPTEVGGTHPVILEALAAGNCVLVNDHAPNAETVGDAGTSPERSAWTTWPSSSAACSTTPISSRRTASALASGRSGTRGTPSPTSTSACSATYAPGASTARCRASSSTSTCRRRPSGCRRALNRAGVSGC